MTKQSKTRGQLVLMICMFLVSIFMTISYHGKISANETDRLTIIAYTVWIVSIFIWSGAIIYKWRRFRQSMK